MREINAELLGIFDSRIDEIDKRIEEKFNKQQLEVLVNNLLDSRINHYIANETHAIGYGKLKAMIVDLVKEKLANKKMQRFIASEVDHEIKRSSHKIAASIVKRLSTKV